MFSPLEQFDAVKLKSLFYLIDMSLFNMLMPLFLMLLLVVFVMYMLEDNYFLVPTTFQYFFELLMNFIFNLMKQQIGVNAYMFFPFMFTLFNFMLFANLLSLIPFGMALTSHIMMIMWLSLGISLSMFIYGLRLNNMQFLKIFMPECPFMLLPLLITIELFSYVMSSFSLAMRLSANIMAGHTLVFIIASSVLSLTKMKWWLFFFGFCLLFLVLCLELGVAFLQAYVFTVLVTMYLNDVFNMNH